MSLITICFIACHGGPADHFSTFAEALVNKGYTVQIYATGPALQKFRDRHIEIVTPFVLENMTEEEAATELAKRCSGAAVIITDVGHGFDISLQQALQSEDSTSLRLAYYDNPEAYVPGGYSSVAAKVMRVAQGVLFANANLVKTPLYQTPSQEVYLAPEKRIGLGYYPISQAEKIAKRRTSEQSHIRAQLFSKYSLVDRGQKVLVYVGGNNDAYFSKALPAFLQFLSEASLQRDLSDFVVLLQQHPGAKEKNRDVILVRQWLEQRGQEAGVARFFISAFNVDDAQVVADGMLYYQTSLGPQFVLAEIPTIQVSHNTYEDILVKNQLCFTATDVSSLLTVLACLQSNVKVESSNEAIMQGLGISSDWARRLEDAINLRGEKASGVAWVRQCVDQYPEILWLAEAEVRKTEEGVATVQGAYSEKLFGQKFIEFDRTIMALHCLQLILDGSDKAYQEFTAAQPENVKLSQQSFNKLHLQGVSLLQSQYQGMSEWAMRQAMQAALVLGDIGKSEKARVVFKPYGAQAPDHDDFHGEVMHILQKNPELCPTFKSLTPAAQKLLSKTANLAHYGHITHIEGGPAMFSQLKQSGVAVDAPVALLFDLFVHTCDVAGALGHVNNQSSLVYTEPSHLAMQGMADACKMLSDPHKTEIDAYNAYLTMRANGLGLDPQDCICPVLARMGAMLRLFTPEEGVILKQAVAKLDPAVQARIIAQLDFQDDKELERTPTYMPAVLVNLANNPELGSSKEERLSQAVILGLPFVSRVLEQHRQSLATHTADPKIPLNFNQAAGTAKTAPKKLAGAFNIDAEGNVNFKFHSV